ncbi:hypothetical protein WN55_10553 [Dufourea novaeangliae]|uniref:Uncharacterized protein n=1 Tax=Dufourea novaeangliae TaxID=178035 RepID=A0A154P486_DUFNO|nr:hypothetical protein WN55_10553 [Dufourea novaeangliae]
MLVGGQGSSGCRNVGVAKRERGETERNAGASVEEVGGDVDVMIRRRAEESVSRTERGRWYNLVGSNAGYSAPTMH